MEIRPVFLRKAERTRGHAVVGWLALKLARQGWIGSGPLRFDGGRCGGAAQGRTVGLLGRGQTRAMAARPEGMPAGTTSVAGGGSGGLAAAGEADVVLTGVAERHIIQVRLEPVSPLMGVPLLYHW